MKAKQRRVVPSDRHNHNIVMAILVLLICVASGLAFWWSFQHVAAIYLAETERAVAEIKLDFLQTTVKNLVREIDALKKSEELAWQTLVQDRHRLLELGMDLSEEDFPRFLASLMEAEPSLTAALWNRATGEIIYQRGQLQVDEPFEDLLYYDGLAQGELAALWGVPRSAVDAAIKDRIRQMVAELELGSGTWVSISQAPPGPEGGDELAYTQRLEDLNLVIAMGVHREELERYAEETAQAGGKLAVLLSLRLVLILVLVVVTALGLVLLAEYLYFRSHTAQLVQEVSIDLLTGAKSRRSGVALLGSSFEEFQAGEESPVIFMCDVDSLKKINDTFGHSAGDQVLQALSAEVERVVGSSGEVIRWAGDEFVIVAPKANEEKLAKRIVRSVSALEFQFGGERVRTSISLGASRFQPGDASYLDALNRADRRLYEFKRVAKARGEKDA